MGNGTKLLRNRTAWRGLLLVAAAWCPTEFVQALTADEMVDHMRRALQFFPDATLSQSVKSEAAWHNVPGSETNPYTATVVDHWRVMTDRQKCGLERHRESPAGPSRVRTVYEQGRRQVFEFDPGVSEDSAILGRLVIRGQGPGGPYLRVPFLEYADRILMIPGRVPMAPQDLEVESEQESIDGHPCHKVHGSWNGRDFTLWLDEAFDCLPRQYTIKTDFSWEGRNSRGFGPRPTDRRVLAPPRKMPGSNSRSRVKSI